MAAPELRGRLFLSGQHEVPERAGQTIGSVITGNVAVRERANGSLRRSKTHMPP